MKKLFLMFIFLSAIVSCGGETKETNKCDGVTCSDWQQCNASNGVCVLKTGRCNSDSDCSGDFKCDENHTCYNSTNPCENQTCSAHGTCVVENNSAKCNCNDGYYSANLNCLENICNDNETRTISCGLNGNGLRIQKCNNNQWYFEGICTDPDECANGTTQLVSNSACANQSLNGRGKAEQICANGQWIDYEGNCKDPDSCEDYAIEIIEGTCGINNRGTKYKKCVTGQWDFKDEYCNDSDICEDGTGQESICGVGNYGVISQFCIEGKWNGSCSVITKQWGTSKEDHGNSVAVDNSGNIFVTGSTAGGLDGNTNASANSYDIFLTKFDTDGNKLWTKQWGTNKEDKGNSVVVDNSGNVFVTGRTLGGLDGNTNVGHLDVFLTKFDNNGTKLWTKQWGTGNSDEGNSVAIDNSGNVFVTGSTGAGLDGNTSAGSGDDIFLNKFDNAGNKQWTKQWGTTFFDGGNSVAVDSSGNVFVTGYTYRGLDGNTNANTSCTGSTYSNCSDIFLTKFDNAGNKLFTKQWGTTSWDDGNSVAVNSSGNVFVTGYTQGGLDLNTNAGSGDIFLTKFDNNGNKQWTEQWGTTSWDAGNSVAVDNLGNVFVTGVTDGGLDNVNTNAGQLDIFLTKIYNERNRGFSRQWGTYNNDYGYSLVIDSSGNIFITGTTNGGLDGNTHIGSTDYTDIFLTKFEAE